jgi:hypothetical protein
VKEETGRVIEKKHKRMCEKNERKDSRQKENKNENEKFVKDQTGLQGRDGHASRTLLQLIFRQNFRRREAGPVTTGCGPRNFGTLWRVRPARTSKFEAKHSAS